MLMKGHVASSHTAHHPCIPAVWRHQWKAHYIFGTLTTTSTKKKIKNEYQHCFPSYSCFNFDWMWVAGFCLVTDKFPSARRSFLRFLLEQKTQRCHSVVMPLYFAGGLLPGLVLKAGRNPSRKQRLVRAARGKILRLHSELRAYRRDRLARLIRLCSYF